jgi:hypothetical protein
MLFTTTSSVSVMTEQFWETVSVAQAVVWVLAAFAILAFVVKAWPFIRNMFNILDALVNLPKYMADTSEKLESIHHEVNYNNGSSVKDAITRIESGVMKAELHMKRQDEKMQEVETRIKKIEK